MDAPRSMDFWGNLIDCLITRPDLGDRGLYEQGHGSSAGKPPPKHSPTHKGYDRNNAREAAFTWMRGVMYEDECALPPVSA